MGDKDVFVKRVDFDVNGKDDSDLKTPLNNENNSDVEKLTDPVKGQSCFVKFHSFVSKYGITAALSHIGLLVSLGLYCFGGGYVFVRLEKPGIDEAEIELRENVSNSRETFIETVIEAREILDREYLSEILKSYELSAEEAVDGGLSLQFEAYNDTNNFPSKAEKWTMLQAIFFASTVCTTIGYGNIAPVTFEGRIFCIFFAVIGIPFTLTVIADYGNLFANSVSFLAKKMKALGNRCRGNKDGKKKKMKGRKMLYAFGALLFLALYLSAGAAVFDEWEDGWSFFDGFYFSFITVTTIGFGDLVPGDYLMLLCTIYILIGLALTSTIIELVRREYVRSWQKLQQLKLGRFAESLKKLGESHTQLDVNDIKHILTIMSRKDSKKDKKVDDTMDAFAAEFLEQVQTRESEKPKIVQIIIYETSV